MCNRCQRSLPETATFFVKGAKYRKGLRPHCRQCNAQMVSEDDTRRAARRTSLVLEFEKACLACKQVLPNDTLHFSKKPRNLSQLDGRCCVCEQIRNMNKRAKKVVQTAAVLNYKEVHALIKQSGLLCKYCGVDVSKGFEFDHVVSLSSGGEHSITNLAIACAECNVAKWSWSTDALRTSTLRRAAFIAFQDELEELLAATTRAEGTLTTDGVSRQTDSRQPTRLVSHSS